MFLVWFSCVFMAAIHWNFVSIIERIAVYVCVCDVYSYSAFTRVYWVVCLLKWMPAILACVDTYKILAIVGQNNNNEPEKKIYTNKMKRVKCSSNKIT